MKIINEKNRTTVKQGEKSECSNDKNKKPPMCLGQMCTTHISFTTH